MRRISYHLSIIDQILQPRKTSPVHLSGEYFQTLQIFKDLNIQKSILQIIQITH
jgi:hypothetical protein